MTLMLGYGAWRDAYGHLAQVVQSEAGDDRVVDQRSLDPKIYIVASARLCFMESKENQPTWTILTC